MSTVPIRLPDEMYDEMVPIARLRGITPGALLADAWERWWRRNGNRIVDEAIADLDAMRPPGAKS